MFQTQNMDDGLQYTNLVNLLDRYYEEISTYHEEVDQKNVRNVNKSCSRNTHSTNIMDNNMKERNKKEKEEERKRRKEEREEKEKAKRQELRCAGIFGI